jgi:peptide/nickel transport system substrate-binding protein
MNGQVKKGSHVNVYFPNLSHITASHSISAGLLRPANNKKGWEYDVAIAHRKITPRIYEFELRKGVKFQDGTPFNADSVLMNMKQFKIKPYTFTKIDTVFDFVEKLSSHTVRFHLKEDYGLFLYDTLWIHFYSQVYLEKYGWNGKPFCPNIAAPGPYGLGPYILTEGNMEADRRTKKAELKANPYYWDENVPKVESITVLMELDPNQAINSVLNTEGIIDLMPIPFSFEVQTILSEYGKLIRTPSNNSYFGRMNLINGHPILQEQEVREALNRAIDQESLIMLSMNGEAQYSPISLATGFYGVKEASNNIEPFSVKESPLNKDTQNRLINIIKKHQVKYGLDPKEKLPLTLMAQKSLLYVLKDIKYFLEQIHIDVTLKIVSSETEMFTNVVATKQSKNEIYYDIVLWANFDWMRNPWGLFFILRPSSNWSTLGDDPLMEKYINLFFKSSFEDANYTDNLRLIIEYIYSQSYTLFLPDPNIVLAYNKEIFFTPRPSSIFPLWEIEVSDNHWSIRDGEYPDELKAPVEITNVNQGLNQ